MQLAHHVANEIHQGGAFGIVKLAIAVLIELPQQLLAAAIHAGDAAQRATLTNKLGQLEYEAKRAFEQYDVVDARNRLAAAAGIEPLAGRG